MRTAPGTPPLAAASRHLAAAVLVMAAIALSAVTSTVRAQAPTWVVDPSGDAFVEAERGIGFAYVEAFSFPADMTQIQTGLFITCDADAPDGYDLYVWLSDAPIPALDPAARQIDVLTRLGDGAIGQATWTVSDYGSFKVARPDETTRTALMADMARGGVLAVRVLAEPALGAAQPTFQFQVDDFARVGALTCSEQALPRPDPFAPAPADPFATPSPNPQEPEPERATGQPRFIQISTTYAHTLALDTNGRAWAWGIGPSGQLGDGARENRQVPTLVVMPDGVRFVRVSAGGTNSYAIDEHGRAWAWGTGEGGRLGNGETRDHATPTLVAMPPGVAFDDIAATAFNGPVTALARDGNVWVWGTISGQMLAEPFQMPSRGTTFTGIAAGGSTLARSDRGEIWRLETVGLTPLGQPADVVFTVMDAGLRDDGGAQHTLAIDRDGRAWGWGSGAFGQLGDGTLDNRNAPTPVAMPAGTRFTAIAAATQHSLAIDQHGHLWAWGRGYAAVPERLPHDPDVRFVTLAVGDGTRFAIDASGGIWAWGAGQLGLGSAGSSAAPRRIAFD